MRPAHIFSTRFLGTGITYPQRFDFEALPESMLSIFLLHFATRSKIRLVITLHIYFNIFFKTFQISLRLGLKSLSTAPS